MAFRWLYVVSERAASEAAAASGGLRVGNRSRIIKVHKLPVDSGTQLDHPTEMLDAKGFTFYGAGQGRPIEFDPPYGSGLGAAFSRTINDLAYDIADVLKFRSPAAVDVVRPVAPTGTTIYLAETTTDVSEQRESLRRELEQFGHTVIPAQSLQHGPQYAARVATELAGARISVHLIGENYGVRPERSDASVVELQYRAAIQERERRPEFRRMMWMPPDAPASEERQRDFVSELENDPEFVVGTLESFKRLVHQALLPPAVPAPATNSGDGAKSVFLIFDPPDGEAAKEVDDWLFTQGFEVRRPSSSIDKAESRRVNTRHLRTSNGVVIYHGNTTESWLFSKLSDLEKVYGQGRTRQRKLSSAVILADPQTPDKLSFRSHRIIAVPGFGGFSPAELRVFVDQLLVDGNGTA